MLSRALPADQDETRELADMIVGEVDRLERVVAGLVELSRPRPSYILRGGGHRTKHQNQREPNPLEPLEPLEPLGTLGTASKTDRSV